jgi:CRP/FNR family transcriptional regulator, anaerobic regulatory protein
MQARNLLEVLADIIPLSGAFREALLKETVTLSLPRKYLLLQAPHVAEQAYFLETGYAMSYSFVAGRRKVEAFWAPGQIVFSPKSFFERVPSTEFIELIEQSDVRCINYVSTQVLLRDYDEARYIQQVVMNQYAERERQRLYDRQYLSAEVRYEKLLASFPGIEQHVSQRCIASYIGITAQSLCRMKRRRGR